MQQSAKHRQPIGVFHSSRWTPHWTVEFGYYLYLFYAVFGSAWGLSLPPLLAGGSIAALSGVCILRLKSDLKRLLAPFGLLLGCLVSFLLIQIAIYGESLMGSTTRAFIVCILGLILIRSLCLRPGLGHRFTFVLFVVGLTALPYIGFKAGVDRAYIEEAVSGNLSNANGLAEWFGFCAVYFGILGLESKRAVLRILSWSAAVLCLFIVGLTVSRGTLLACGIALVLAFRRIFKRGFVPLLLLIILVWAITESGLFRDIFSLYMERGTEDTGRFVIWPEAVKEFLSSPVVGLGAANSSVIVPGEWRPRSPHNTFLFFALSSGIVPPLFFISFWIVALRKSLANIEQQEYGPFRAPLLMYVLLISFTGDLGFTFPAGLLGLVLGAGDGASYRLPRFLVVAKYHERHMYKVRRRLRPGTAAFAARRRP
jgi:O-antigen ligase